MFMVQLRTYLCMYLPQAVSLPQLLGIERDFFRCRHLVEEVELELVVVGCSVAEPLFPATPLQLNEAGAQGKDRAFPA